MGSILCFMGLHKKKSVSLFVGSGSKREHHHGWECTRCGEKDITIEYWNGRMFVPNKPEKRGCCGECC